MVSMVTFPIPDNSLLAFDYALDYNECFFFTFASCNIERDIAHYTEVQLPFNYSN